MHLSDRNYPKKQTISRKSTKKAVPKLGTAFSLFENVLSESDLINISALFGDNFEFEINNHFFVKFHFCSVITNFFDRVFLNKDLFTVNFEAFFF